MYSIKETYVTLQGEGALAGSCAVFCRFSGCNLWSGREEDRATAACTFCDTDFVGTDGPGGGKFATADDVADHLVSTWNGDTGSPGNRLVVFTGGEPTLQLDDELVEACQARGFRVAIETNGTRSVPANVDWICVSPKPGSEIVQKRGHELKFVYPQETLSPNDFEALDFEHFFVQPMDGPRQEENIAAAIAFCRSHPAWRLSLQTHKLLGIP
jgi:7-carboxy-7-deazaguanine synthase